MYNSTVHDVATSCIAEEIPGNTGLSLVMPSLLMLDEGGLVGEDPVAIVTKCDCLIFSFFLLSDHVGLVQARPALHIANCRANLRRCERRHLAQAATRANAFQLRS